MQNNTPKAKIFYIDNLRVLLTILVVMHHTFITYGAPGGWYFTDKTTNETALILMTLFVATNQAFFMGFFFFLSALFTEPSYEKKGAAKKFIADRLKRLGIPLLFYSFILSPIMNFLVYKFGYGKQANFFQYLGGYDDWIDPGVLWFVAALLLFTLIYVVIKKLTTKTDHKTYAFPNNRTIFIVCIIVGRYKFSCKNNLSCWLGFASARFPVCTLYTIHCHVYFGIDCIPQQLA